MTGVSGPLDLAAEAATARQPAKSPPDISSGSVTEQPGAQRARGGWLGRLEETRSAARLASLLAVLLIVAAFGMVVTRAVALDFHNRQPTWVVDAIPAVLSEIYFGWPKRYTALESVHRRFFARVDREVATARPINAAMNRIAETANEDPGTAYRLLGPDDKGIVDLIKGGFVLFGVRTESIVTFYFVLLLLSCTLYVAAFWRSQSALLLLAAFLGMFYLVMPMIMYNGQLRSVLALRVLPILSMVACLHCLLFMATSLHARVSPFQVLLVALQVLLITFTIHLRSTTLWQVATILGFGAVLLAVSWVRRRGAPLPPSPSPSREEGGSAMHEGAEGNSIQAGAMNRAPTDNHPVGARFIAPSRAAPAREQGGQGGGVRGSSMLAVGATIGLMVAGYFGLQAYHAVALPEEYRRGDEIATRVFWHNIFTGFAYHPELRDRFEIRLDDVSIMAATGRYLAEIDRLDIWQEMGGRLPVPDASNGSASSFEGIKFARYDPVVRDMLIARCTTLVRQCLETFVWYKPVSLLGNLAWLYGFRDLPPDLEVTVSPYFGDILERQFLGMSQGLDGSGTRAFLWTPRVLLIVAPFVVLLLVESGWRTWAAFSACLGLALGSTITTIAGYAAPHTISESAIAFGMLIYLGLCCLLAAGLKRAVSRRAPMDVTASTS